MSSQKPPYIYLDDQLSGHERFYKNPVQIIEASNPQDVDKALEALQRASHDGYYLAGYFSYELGYLLEPVLAGLSPPRPASPLLQFGVFAGYTDKPKIPKASDVWIENISPHRSLAEYSEKFSRVLKYIRAGDVYQINLSFPIQARTNAAPLALYEHLKGKQPVHFGAVMDFGRDGIVSLSPELFFETDGEKINLRPMKGTIRRGGSAEEDKALAKSLQNDAKSQAENLMIVDLLRNDVARISKPGSVSVKDLFQIETYPSLHTMTSNILADLQEGIELKSVVRALFPCGSVTGAPKIRAMEIIRELERSERGVYCGALGYIDPGGKMSMSVGIRTMTVSRDGQIRYPVGSGIVADSQARLEYEECLLKAKTLASEFKLIETLGWHEQTGFMHLDLHLARLARSSQVLGFSYRSAVVEAALHHCMRGKSGPHKVRVELSRDGKTNVQSRQFTPVNPHREALIAISPITRDSRDPLLVHKTTQRSFLQHELASRQERSGCDEVVFENERGEICEGCYSNIFLKHGDVLLTPPVSSGLLPGILREVLLTNGQAREHVITKDVLRKSSDIYIGNSLRGLRRARLV